MENTSAPVVTDERGGLPSASGLERIALCPGSWNLEKTLPPLPTAADADSGTRIHEALAGSLSALRTLSEEELEVYGKCEEQAKALKEFYIPAPGNAVVYKEIREWLYVDDVPVLSGKADYVAINRGVGLIIDYKTGRGDVTESPKNLQLRALAAIMAQSFGLSQITVAVVQPWVTSKPEATEYEIKDLKMGRLEIAHHLDIANDPNAPRIPGIKQCQYCRAKGACPEAAKFATSVASMTVSDMSPADLAIVLEKIPVIETIIEGVRQRARTILQSDPHAIPGWNLEPGDVRRNVVNPQGAFIALAEQRLIDAQEFVGCCKVKITELEKAVAEFSKITRKEAKETINRLCESHIEKKPNQPTLVKVPCLPLIQS